jgi:hypothetical protein
MNSVFLSRPAKPAVSFERLGEHGRRRRHDRDARFPRLRANQSTSVVVGQPDGRRMFEVRGRLVEIRIYPADLGLGEPRRPLSRANVPLTPTPQKARAILEKLQKYSEPFGTKISIENNIGIIRVPPEATVGIGGDLAIPGRGPTRPRRSDVTGASAYQVLALAVRRATRLAYRTLAARR